jgi:Protein of unknown function (DUF1565)
MMKNLFLFIFWTTTGLAFAGNLYVSPGGSDLASGALGQPWRTVQKAANSARPGDVVSIRAGTYYEQVAVNVQGTAGSPIVFQGYPGERAIISGAGRALGTGSQCLIKIANKSYVTIQGLEVTNLTTSSPSIMPMGIFVYANGNGTSVGVKVIGCQVYNIQHNYAPLYSGDANAHGIAVYGYSSLGVRQVEVSSNTVRDLRLGASEAVVFNGNVDGIACVSNTVYNCNNIGIDFIGGEGVCMTSSLDKARNGRCASNVVYNIDSQYNPAYGGNFAGKFASANARNDTRAAPAIYVDGGEGILIERNTMRSSNFGLSLGAENSWAATRNCVARNNLIRHNHVGGVVLGGAERGNGGSIGCYLINNTIAYNDTTGYGGGALMIQYNTQGCMVRNNLMVSLAASATYMPQFVLKSSNDGSWLANSIDYNIYAGAPAGDFEFIWNGVGKYSWSAWKAVGQDAHSIFTSGSAGFTSASLGNYYLAVTSIAKDKGDPLFLPANGELDHGGGARVVGTRVDIGMDEFAP